MKTAIACLLLLGTGLLVSSVFEHSQVRPPTLEQRVEALEKKVAQLSTSTTAGVVFKSVLVTIYPFNKVPGGVTVSNEHNIFSWNGSGGVQDFKLNHGIPAGKEILGAWISPQKSDPSPSSKHVLDNDWAGYGGVKWTSQDVSVGGSPQENHEFMFVVVVAHQK